MITRKIVMLGEIGVGKSSIVRRLVFNRFEAEYKATVGADVYQYEVAPSPAGEPFHFVIWDTDGNFGDAIFRSVHIRQAHAALIVADASRRATVDTLARLAAGFIDAMPARYMGLVVNKLDLIEDGGEPPLPPIAASGEFPLFRTSAKTGLNVKSAFHEAAATIVRRS